MRYVVFILYVVYMVYQYKSPYHFHKTLYVYCHSYYYNLCYIKVGVSIEIHYSIFVFSFGKAFHTYSNQYQHMENHS